MVRAFILWQGLVEPSFEKLHSFVVDLWNYALGRKIPFGKIRIPILGQSFKTVEAMQVALWVEKNPGPVPRCIAFEYAKLQI